MHSRFRHNPSKYENEVTGGGAPKIRETSRTPRFLSRSNKWIIQLLKLFIVQPPPLYCPLLAERCSPNYELIVMTISWATNQDRRQTTWLFHSLQSSVFAFHLPSVCFILLVAWILRTMNQFSVWTANPSASSPPPWFPPRSDVTSPEHSSIPIQKEEELHRVLWRLYAFWGYITKISIWRLHIADALPVSYLAATLTKILFIALAKSGKMHL
jgi:hypothetical protein